MSSHSTVCDLDRAFRRRHPLGDGTEVGGEPALIVLSQLLVAEDKDGMLMPGILDLVQRAGIKRSAEIGTTDFRANERMQLGD